MHMHRTSDIQYGTVVISDTIYPNGIPPSHAAHAPPSRPSLRRPWHRVGSAAQSPMDVFPNWE